MEKFDSNTEAQVWQRVFAQPQQPRRDDLRALMLTAMEAAGAYRYLANVLTDQSREQAKRLYEGEQATIASLKGLSVLSGTGAEKSKTITLPKEPVGKLLEKSYHRAKRAMTEYTARSVDGEFGVVFQRLAQREGEHCAMIAELLGRLKT